MKKIILLALASLPAVVFAQNNKFSIQGTVGTLNAPAKVYLRYDFENKAITDSAIITNGKFQFSGPAKADGGLISGNIILNKNGTGVSYNDWKNIYLEAGTITVTADNDMASAKITGTKTNDEKAQFDVAYKVINDGFEALDAKEKAAPDDVKNSESFQREIHKAQKEL